MHPKEGLRSLVTRDGSLTDCHVTHKSIHFRSLSRGKRFWNVSASTRVSPFSVYYLRTLRIARYCSTTNFVLPFSFFSCTDPACKSAHVGASPAWKHMPLPAHTTAGARLGAATARDEQDGSAALKPRETLNRDLEQKPSTPSSHLPPSTPPSSPDHPSPTLYKRHPTLGPHCYPAFAPIARL